MAYVPEFQNDVFISFTHVDNLPPTEGEKGWITLFHECLEKRLQSAKKGPGKVSVWRDRKLQGNDLLSETIKAELAESAVLVCVMSRQYLGSEWCRWELDSFWNKEVHGFGPRVDHKLRVFKVLINDVPREEQPTVVSDPVLGFEFFDRSPAEGLVKQYWPHPANHPDQRFWPRFERLADAIADLLDRMRAIVVARGTDPSPVSAPKAPIATVYLADVTDDLQDDRYVLAKELRGKNVRVLPERTLPTKRSDAEPLIREGLAASRLSIHLLSVPYGRRLEDDESRSLPHLQYEMARERAAQAKQDFTRIVWLSPDVVAGKGKSPQRELVEQLENEADLPSPLELRKESLEKLTETILTKLAPPRSGNIQRRMVYVTGQPADLTSEDTKRLIAHCRQHHDVSYPPPAIAGDEEKRNRIDATNMKQSDGLMILYGHAPPDWVHEKAMQARLQSQRRRKRPLKTAVYEEPPGPKADIGIDIENVLVLDGSGGFDPSKIGPFLQRLED